MSAGYQSIRKTLLTRFERHKRKQWHAHCAHAGAWLTCFKIRDSGHTLRSTSPEATISGLGDAAMPSMSNPATAGLHASARARPSRRSRCPVAASCSAAITTALALLMRAKSAMRVAAEPPAAPATACPPGMRLKSE